MFAYDEVPNHADAATVTVTTKAEPPPPDTTAPGPVTGLQTSGVTTSSVVLSWTNPGDGDFAGVLIRRTVGSVPPSSPTDGVLVADVAAPDESFTDSGLAAETQYSYALFAYDEVPNHADAATVTVTTKAEPPPPDTTAPGPVTGLQTSEVTTSSVVLSWTNPGDGDFAGVLIRRTVGSVPPSSPTDGVQVAKVAAPGNGFTDSGLAADTQYSYALFAYDEVPNYADAATVTVTTKAEPPPPDTTAPGPVTGLQTSGVTTSSVVLSWTNPGDGDFAGVLIRRTVGSVPPSSPTDGVQVAKVAAPGNSFTDSGLAAETQYSYALFAYDEVPNHADAATVTVTTKAEPPPPDTTAPGPVTGLQTSGVTTSGVVLSWTNPGDGDFAGVLIRRTVGSVPPSSPTDGVQVAKVAAPGNSFTDSGLAAETQYSYAVFAYDEVPNHAKAATVTVTTDSLPDVSGRFVSAVSADGRYFVDQTGAPILVRGDSPWALLVDASQAQMDTYVSTRQSQGFNAVLVSLLGSTANGGPSDSGATFDGLLPFVNGDPSQLNDAYWDRVEHFIARCREAGITVMAYPIDGWAGTDEFGGLARSWSTVTATAYGRAVAARLSAYDNVIWAVGGDFTIGQATEDARFAAVLAGLAAGGMDRPSTVQFTLNSTSLSSPFWRALVDFSFVYSYAASYAMVENGYQETTLTGAHVPAILGETHYEGYPQVTNRYLRSQVAWALTSGSPGDFYGSEDVWDTAPTPAALNTVAVAQISALRAAFAGLDGWQRLRPDYASAFITAGRGTKAGDTGEYFSGNTYVTGAVTDDGTLAVVYLPDATRSITLNTGLLGSGFTARWIDPTNGASHPTSAATSYSLPDANAAGDHDWLLVLEADTPRSQRTFSEQPAGDTRGAPSRSWSSPWAGTASPSHPARRARAERPTTPLRMRPRPVSSTPPVRRRRRRHPGVR